MIPLNQKLPDSYDNLMELPVLVTPEEDAELTMIIQQEVKPFKETKPRLPTPFCRKRNPQNRGGNVTKKKPETMEFQILLETHVFLQKPRKRWTIAQREKYDDLLLSRTHERVKNFQFLNVLKIRLKHAKNIEESWEEKLRNEKEKMLIEFLNKRFRDHIARHKKKSTVNYNT